jgi:hypothetical protein
MTKINRLKNYWLGMENIEQLVLSININSNEYASQFVSLDKIHSTQKIIFEVEELLRREELIFNKDFNLIENEIQVLLKLIVDVQDDFQMHKEIIINLMNARTNKYLELNEKNKGVDLDFKILEEKNFANKKHEVEDDLIIDENKTKKNYVQKEIINNLNNIKKHTRVKQEKKNISLNNEGFNINHLNQKNRIIFDSLLQRLRNQKGIIITEEESEYFYKVQAVIVDQINLRELGYLIEMKKLGLKIIDKSN